jgi:peptidoglycan/LPS O-acetylase OafA/YrhL
MLKKLTRPITEIPELLNQKYLPTLDGLRAVAVIIVIIAHLNHRVFKSELIDTIIPTGNLGVYIFFVLSGFLITTLLLKEKVKTGTISLTSFYRRRFFRIIPVAYLFLLVVMLLKVVFALPITWAQVGFCFLFFRSMEGNFNRPFVGHFWSLSYEEQYYLMYPIVLKKSLKLFLALIGLVLLLQFFYGIPYLYHHVQFPGKKIIYRLFIHSFDGLAIGSLFAVLMFQKIIKPLHSKYLGLINLLLIASFIFLHALPINFPVKIFSSSLIALFIMFNIHPNNKTIFYTFLNWKPMVFLGQLSYSIYIWQQLFTMDLPWAGKSTLLDSIWLNLVVLFIVAYCSYNFYEKFFFRFKQAKSSKRGTE